MEPKIFINFKHYENAVGKNSELFLEQFNTIKNQDNVVYCLSEIDLRLNCKFPGLNIFSQNVNSNGYGPYTGHISIEALKSIGINGSIINHSENRLPETEIKAIVKRAHELNFTIVLCAENLDEIKSFAELNPDYIAYEPPELIGGNISVSSSKPDIIKDAVKLCSGKSKLLVGAGIKTGTDISKSMELGATGVLIASGIVRNAKPINTLVSLMENR
ncbi:MAG: triose-phosphate isomerase [Ferroplasma sp.]